MVRLVFCPCRQLKPGAFTHHLPGLVEHAELSQRVEAWVELPGPRADGTGASATNWAALVSTDCPGAICKPNSGVEAPLEKWAGSTPGWGFIGSRVCCAHGREEACRSPDVPKQHA